MELAGSLALATAGIVASGSAGGVIPTAQAAMLGLALARRTPARRLPPAACAFGVGYLSAALRAGAPLALPGGEAGPGPAWAGVALGAGWAAVGVWALLRRGARARPGGGARPRQGAGSRSPAAAPAALAILLGLVGGVLAGWSRPPHAGPMLALLVADPPAGGAALAAGTDPARAVLLYHAGTAIALALVLALAGAAAQRILTALRLGWLGALLLVVWGVFCGLGGYGRAAEFALRYWPLQGLG